MKVTKGHFNRKVLFFGLLLFLAISLISTGFAAWIMSTGAEEGSSSSVQVGTVTDGSLEFSAIKLQEGKSKIILDALTNDNTGDIKGDPSGANENLSVVFTTTLTPATYVQDLTISIKVPGTVKAAADAGYITMPTCCYVDKNPVLTVELIKDGIIQTLAKETGIEAKIEKAAEGDTYNITITVKFGWGSQFGGKNPGIYLDEADDYQNPETGYDLKVQKMVNFKKTIYGLTVAEDGSEPAEGEVSKDQLLAYNELLPLDILLTAVAK